MRKVRPRQEPEEMLPEYDFSAGVRGKYATRFRKDTIRTNLFIQGAVTTGTLAHPLAQKIAQRIKDAKLK